MERITATTVAYVWEGGRMYGERGVCMGRGGGANVWGGAYV